MRQGGGGGGGIRNHGTLARTTVFETAPFDHSGTPPRSAARWAARPLSTPHRRPGQLQRPPRSARSPRNPRCRARGAPSRRRSDPGRARSRPSPRRRCCRGGSSRARRTACAPPGAGETALTTQCGRCTEPGLGSSSSTISSTVTSTRPARERHLSFCTPEMPQSMTLPLQSACWAWITATSGRMAGLAASFFAAEGTGDELDDRVVRRQVRADVAPDHREGQPARARDVGVGEVGVAAFLDLQRPGPALLHRVAKAMQRAHPRIAAP